MGAGGATRGYQSVGFRVVGVDLDPQPNYCGDEFVQADALAFLRWVDLSQFSAIHASFPCQLYTDYRRKGHGVGDGYLDLITPGRPLLEATGLPWVMENVPRAPLIDAVRICGTSFPGLDVQRHRMFESNFPLVGTRCNHMAREPRYPGATNRAPNSRRVPSRSASGVSRSRPSNERWESTGWS